MWTENDLPIFVRDFGIEISYRGVITGLRRITAIFDNEYDGVIGESLDFAARGPRLTCMSPDVAGIRYGDDVFIEGSTYKVVTVMPNGTGTTEILLELQDA